MTCYHPLRAWRVRGGHTKNHTWPITFTFSEGLKDKEVIVPCGQCIGCRLDRSRAWAIRCVLEQSQHEHSEFLTLTYDDEHLPEDSSLQKKDVQLFIKRLRRNFKLRYYMCGEYGDKMERPHYHLCLFGIEFLDKVPLPARFQKAGYVIYESPTITSLWDKGLHSIGELNFESAAYVARYVVKKIRGPEAENHYGKREPEFALMSRRPGIGRSWFEEYAEDTFKAGKIITQNLTCKVPKYYDDIVKAKNPKLYKEIKEARKLKILPEEQEWFRLKTKEEYARLKAQKLKRGYEKWQLKKERT